MTCWALWKVRNEQVWSNKGATVGKVLMLAHTTLEQWTKAQNKSITPTAAFLSEEDGDTKWVRPDEGWVKINVDAALFTEAGTYSFACVARDYTGTVLEALSSCRRGLVAPEIAEALGVKEALGWLKRKQWQNVVLQTDSLLVIQSLRSHVSMLSYFGSIISDCKGLLQDLSNVSVVFVRRSANSVAHFLARASYYVADRIIRSDDVSPEFLYVIMNDCE